MNFADVKVGDVVAYKRGVMPGLVLKGIVSRVTAMQFVVTDGTKFRKKDGQKVGGFGYAEPWSAAHDAKFAAQEARTARLKLWQNVRSALDARDTIEHLTNGHLTQIAKIIAHAKGAKVTI